MIILYLTLKTARSYLHSTGRNTAERDGQTDRQTNGRTDRQSDLGVVCIASNEDELQEHFFSAFSALNQTN